MVEDPQATEQQVWRGCFEQAIVAPKNSAHFARYMSGIFDKKEKQRIIVMIYL
ncbi:MAG: hypothetical protein ACXWPS_07090 [Ktedonobacteraceae bacterium]